MKNLIQTATVLFLLVNTIGYSQTKHVGTNSKKQDSILKDQITSIVIDTTELKKFVGVYFLEEGNFTLEITKEDNEMYIISPFSKDMLTQKNKTTLHEPTRGVDLELIADHKNALKFTQNGYETLIKRVDSKPEKE